MNTQQTTNTINMPETCKHILSLPSQLRHLNKLGQMRHGLFAQRKKNPQAGDILVFIDAAPQMAVQATCREATTVKVTEHSIIEANPARPEQPQIISGAAELETFSILHGFPCWADLREYIKQQHSLPATCLYVSW